ncbi:MAG: hypothetical protein ABI867_43635 [Kofleriaceae bacterium]
MRWLVCCVLLAGCLRARATVIHPTELERSGGAGTHTTIARTAPATRETPSEVVESPTLASVELGALLAFDGTRGSARVHVAPGIRIFSSQLSQVLFGVAVGADFVRDHGPGFAIEGSYHAGNGGNDPLVIEQALDLFAGVSMHSKNRVSASMAIGPSVGVLAMPGGHSVVMVGLGLRLTGGRTY